MKPHRNTRRPSREMEERRSSLGKSPTPLSPSPTLCPSSPLVRASLAQPKLNLPVPIYTPVDHSKKSHARKQPTGHIPRPRNAFILFRCNFVDQNKIPSSVERDHRNISRIVGGIWRQMSDAEKAPWVRMADDEKRAHFTTYPGYRFSRAGSSTARPVAARRGREEDEASSRGSESPRSHESFVQGSSNLPRLSLPSRDDGRTASSSPGIDAPSVRWEATYPFPEAGPATVRDEFVRRPNSVMLSESARYDDPYTSFDNAHTLGGYTMRYSDGTDGYTSTGHQDMYDWQGIVQDRHNYNAQSDGPRLNAIRMPMPDMDHPSELDSVDTWEDWHTTQRQKSISPPKNEIAQENSPEYSNLIMADTVDFDISPTLPPLPMSESPESLHDEYQYTGPSSPIEHKNSFYSPRSGTWKLPLPVATVNSGTSAGFSSTSQINYGLSFPDNLIDGVNELRYPDAEELSGRTRASVAWSVNSPESSGSSAQVDERQVYRLEAQREHRGAWRSSLREGEGASSSSAASHLHRGWPSNPPTE